MARTHSSNRRARQSQQPEAVSIEASRCPITSLIMTINEFRTIHRNGWWSKNNGKKAIIIPPGMILDETLVLVTPFLETIPDFRTIPGMTHANHIPVIVNNEHISLNLLCISSEVPMQITVDWEGCCAELMLDTDEIPESCCVVSIDDNPISVVFVD